MPKTDTTNIQDLNKFNDDSSILIADVRSFISRVSTPTEAIDTETLVRVRRDLNQMQTRFTELNQNDSIPKDEGFAERGTELCTLEATLSLANQRRLELQGMARELLCNELTRCLPAASFTTGACIENQFVEIETSQIYLHLLNVRKMCELYNSARHVPDFGNLVNAGLVSRMLEINPLLSGELNERIKNINTTILPETSAFAARFENFQLEIQNCQIKTEEWHDLRTTQNFARAKMLAVSYRERYNQYLEKNSDFNRQTQLMRGIYDEAILYYSNRGKHQSVRQIRHCISLLQQLSLNIDNVMLALNSNIQILSQLISSYDDQLKIPISPVNDASLADDSKKQITPKRKRRSPLEASGLKKAHKQKHIDDMSMASKHPSTSEEEEEEEVSQAQISRREEATHVDDYGAFFRDNPGLEPEEHYYYLPSEDDDEFRP